LWCVSNAGDERWRLEFELRGTTEQTAATATESMPARFDEVRTIIEPEAAALAASRATAEQLRVIDFRLSTRRLGAGQRTDGVVIFERPSFKQSSETLFLQVADSGAVDLPALAPIGFGISSFRGGSAYEAR